MPRSWSPGSRHGSPVTTQRFALRQEGVSAVVTLRTYAINEPVVVITHDAPDFRAASRICAAGLAEAMRQQPSEPMYFTFGRGITDGQRFQMYTNHAAAGAPPVVAPVDRPLDLRRIAAFTGLTERDMFREMVELGPALETLQQRGGADGVTPLRLVDGITFSH